MTTRLARRTTLALLVAAGLALAAPAAAAPRDTRGDGWLAALRGGLERIFGAEGGCIDPDGARCKAQPTGNGATGGVTRLPAAGWARGVGAGGPAGVRGRGANGASR